MLQKIKRICKSLKTLLHWKENSKLHTNSTSTPTNIRWHYQEFKDALCLESSAFGKNGLVFFRKKIYNSSLIKIKRKVGGERQWERHT